MLGVKLVVLKCLGMAAQVVSGPEILDKWVGAAEARVRALFSPAERGAFPYSCMILPVPIPYPCPSPARTYLLPMPLPVTVPIPCQRGAIPYLNPHHHDPQSR